MSQSRKSRAKTQEEARAAAEDCAVAYLEKLSPQDAFATAFMAESTTSADWSAEQAKMLERGDNREVFKIDDDDFKRMQEAKQLVPPGANVHVLTLHLILRTLGGLKSDEKWKVASAIHFRAAVRALLPDGSLPLADAPTCKTREILGF
jgi:hypothetical protein